MGCLKALLLHALPTYLHAFRISSIPPLYLVLHFIKCVTVCHTYIYLSSQLVLTVPGIRAPRLVHVTHATKKVMPFFTFQRRNKALVEFVHIPLVLFRSRPSNDAHSWSRKIAIEWGVMRNTKGGELFVDWACFFLAVVLWCKCGLEGLELGDAG